MLGRLSCALGALTLSACGSAAAIPASPAQTARAHRCGPSQAHTIAADAVARVYSYRGKVFGCSMPGAKDYKLGFAERSSRLAGRRVGPVALAGRVAAYGLTSSAIDTVSSELLVRQLSNGHVVHQLSATTTTPGPEFVQSLTAVVVKQDGAAAWIGTAGSILSRKREIEVHRVDARGAALLDSGTGIAPHSLRLHGSTLSWTDAGTKRSATLS